MRVCRAASACLSGYSACKFREAAGKDRKLGKHRASRSRVGQDLNGCRFETARFVVGSKFVDRPLERVGQVT